MYRQSDVESFINGRVYELSKLNVSNPAIRKAELMVRIRGFEDYAKQMDLLCPILDYDHPI